MSRYLRRGRAGAYGDRMRDAVDSLLDQWSQERPEFDWSGLSIVVRVQLLAKLMRTDAEEALAPLDLKLWEYDVLSALRRQGPPFELPASGLARASLLTSGAMTTRIDRLAEKRLVRRQADPCDRRSVRVRLTARGVRVIDQAIAARLRAADEQIASLSRRERQSVSEGLRKVLATVGDRTRPRSG